MMFILLQFTGSVHLLFLDSVGPGKYVPHRYSTGKYRRGRN